MPDASRENLHERELGPPPIVVGVCANLALPR